VAKEENACSDILDSFSRQPRRKIKLRRTFFASLLNSIFSLAVIKSHRETLFE